MLYADGTPVTCGLVDMSRFRLNGSRERRWFTDKSGFIVKAIDGVEPPSYFVAIGNKQVMLSHNEVFPR